MPGPSPETLEVIRQAEADPEGARQALFDFGRLTGWPPGGIPPIPVGRGPEAWRIALDKYPPSWLGIAWAKVERKYPVTLAKLETQTPVAEGDTPESQARKEEAEMKVKPTVGLEPGFYPVVITEITETTSEFTDKKTGKVRNVDQFVFQFIVLDDDNQETEAEIRGYTTAAWGLRSKLYKWAQAILRNRCPAANDEFDTDLLLRKRADIEVVPNSVGNSKVENVYPFRTMSAAPTDDEEDPAPAPKAKQPVGALPF